MLSLNSDAIKVQHTGLKLKCISMYQKQNYGQPFRGNTAVKVHLFFASIRGEMQKHSMPLLPTPKA